MIRPLAVVLFLAVFAPPAAGQVVTGTLVSEATSRVLVGVDVALEREDGGPVDAVALDPSGRFTLHAPAPGRYRLRVGLGEPVVSDPFLLGEGDTTTLHLSVGPPDDEPGSGRGGALPGGVEGRVHDAVGGAPLAGASVTLSGVSGTLATDGAGRFHLPTLAPGRHEVRVERLGYLPLLDTVDVAAGAVLDVEVALFPSALSVPGLRVEVDANAPPRAGFTRTRITADDILELSAMDLEGVLAAGAGPRVRIRSRGAGTGGGACVQVARSGAMAADAGRQVDRMLGRDGGATGGRPARDRCRQALLVVDGHAVTDPLRYGSDGGVAVESVLGLRPEIIESMHRVVSGCVALSVRSSCGPALLAEGWMPWHAKCGAVSRIGGSLGGPKVNQQPGRPWPKVRSSSSRTTTRTATSSGPSSSTEASTSPKPRTDGRVSRRSSGSGRIW